MLNAAAKILTRTKKMYHITPMLASLHWLPVKARAAFKVLLLTYSQFVISGVHLLSYPVPCVNLNMLPLILFLSEDLSPRTMPQDYMA